jgi:hypothetical protein
MGPKFSNVQQTTHAHPRTNFSQLMDTNSLREAALQASWQRDHQVARRRTIWRWAMFWGWKYGRKFGIALVPVAIICYLATPLWLAMFSPNVVSKQIVAVPANPTVSASPPVVKARGLQESEDETGMILVPALTLGTASDHRLKVLQAEPSGQQQNSSNQRLRATSNIQTSPKESSP